MQHHELTEFDAACRRSLDDADAWLDRFLDGGGCTTKGDLPGGVGKPVYPTQRTTDCYDDDLVSTETRHSSTRLLLLAAGAAAEVERLRREGLAGDGYGVQVTSEPWARFDGSQVDETAAAPPEPDRQALACLRLLQPRANTPERAWVTLVANRRLTQLLVEYPVLMHPRLVWDVRKLRAGTRAPDPSRSKFANDVEAAPLTQIIANTNQARFPSLEMGVSSVAYRAFAVHPAVAAGIRAPAPHLVAMGPAAGHRTWGQTLGELLLQSDVIQRGFLSNLLRMDRIRRGSGLPTMLDGDRQTVKGFERSIGLAFHAGWMYTGGPDWQSPLAPDSFNEELRLDSRFHASTLSQSGLYLHKVFGANCPSTEAAQVSARARFARLSSSFVGCGLAPNEVAASALVRRLMLPAVDGREDTSEYQFAGGFAELLSKATFDEVHWLLQCWMSEGESIGAMHDSVCAGLGNSAWEVAAAVLKRQHDMHARIEAEAAPCVASEGGQASRRARRRAAV